jgi:uncharacterized damage-inducible protein DinB
MSVIATMMEQWDVNRNRTLATLDAIVQFPEAQEILAWRPGPGRAHIGWQLTHVGITEELFATERLLGTKTAWPALVPRFKGGSTPDDNVPSAGQIRELLQVSREHLVSTMSAFSDADLGMIPEAFRERGWTLGMILKVVSWHEAHHQGQAHLTLNLWKAGRAA